MAAAAARSAPGEDAILADVAPEPLEMEEPPMADEVVEEGAMPDAAGRDR
jgi:hypothetical protein